VRFFAALLVALACGAARAEDAITVSGLLHQGFDVVGVNQTSAGAGIFMRKADKMYACFVSETPTSPTISTRYCKPVE
jgi:predicted porin